MHNTTTDFKLIDSHCHLQLMDLADFHGQVQAVLDTASQQGVSQVLCVCVAMEHYPTLCEFVMRYPAVSISVGVHPNHEDGEDPSVDALVQYAQHPGCVAIGETGLDYYRAAPAKIQAQQARLIRHIAAACLAKKPLIIHTRQAASETLAILKAENASTVGGVMHCFTESWEVAKAAMDLGFYISISGIVTFKNATALQEVAKKVPLDRLLIETDSPYLAPVPYRGKPNHPALVYHVAAYLAELRNEPLIKIANCTTTNFFNCFPLAKTVL